MFAVRCIAFLCLVSVSHSAPLECKELLQPMDPVNPGEFEGRWALVGVSMNVIESAWPVELTDSLSIDFYNTTLIRSYGQHCRYFPHQFTLDGPHYDFSVGHLYNFSGTVFQTSCSDCFVVSYNHETPNLKLEHLCLFSKRRAVSEKEMNEFRAQVKCSKMPEVVVMDPTKQLCPGAPLSSSA